MIIEQFIEKAFRGGWNPKAYPDKDSELVLNVTGHFRDDALPAMIEFVLREWTAYRIFLTPEAWKAVGKAEGWDDDTAEIEEVGSPESRGRMIGMIDALAEGKTIEQYLETL